MNLAATRRNWPTGRGFERFYGFLGAETNQWYPDPVYDNHPVDQPTTPEEGYHFTEDITGKALEFIKDAKAIAPDKPFFLYYAPGAAHAPHHVPREWIERRGRHRRLPVGAAVPVHRRRHQAGRRRRQRRAVPRPGTRSRRHARQGIATSSGVTAGPSAIRPS
jgi:arylsulfatase A-like enzyme